MVFKTLNPNIIFTTDIGLFYYKIWNSILPEGGLGGLEANPIDFLRPDFFFTFILASSLKKHKIIV